MNRRTVLKLLGAAPGAGGADARIEMSYIGG